MPVARDPNAGAMNPAQIPANAPKTTRNTYPLCHYFMRPGCVTVERDRKMRNVLHRYNFKSADAGKIFSIGGVQR